MDATKGCQLEDRGAHYPPTWKHHPFVTPGGKNFISGNASWISSGYCWSVRSARSEWREKVQLDPTVSNMTSHLVTRYDWICRDCSVESTPLALFHLESPHVLTSLRSPQSTYSHRDPEVENALESRNPSKVSGWDDFLGTEQRGQGRNPPRMTVVHHGISEDAVPLVGSRCS